MLLIPRAGCTGGQLLRNLKLRVNEATVDLMARNGPLPKRQNVKVYQ